ncbi:hypothetical protein [Chondromyces apiculatus]|uniref:Lipoprotein n=1 Tax=Chondromyces apiculatus DSM 436 TaxID=1192034 RepID=A0A017TFU5_9BACT|nr:hypothetical protein [Chondromyces apiculatus]EYF07695.1 Hypothetical protein CAP_8196 [Chondromyces apiculatus DSM 436]
MRSTALASCLLAACALTTVACSPVAPILPSVQHPDAALDEPSPDVSKIPPSPQRPLTGSLFVRTIAEEDEAGRERAILREISRGNLPDALRHLARVEFQATAQSGATHTVTLWAMPDYLAIGSDADHLRMPMSPVTAQIIADTFGFLLPTAKIVDTLYAHAATRLTPRPLAPSARMVHPDEFAHHDRLIEEQLGAVPRDQLLAGHKKDVVLSNKLSQRPHRVAIYGWHEQDSHPIQPLSTLHGDWYSDYSHGIRLISAQMLLDGKPMQVADALTDPELAPLLSDEGPLLSTRYRTQEGVGKLKWWPKPEVPETPTSVAIR